MLSVEPRVAWWMKFDASSKSGILTIRKLRTMRACPDRYCRCTEEMIAPSYLGFDSIDNRLIVGRGGVWEHGNNDFGFCVAIFMSIQVVPGTMQSILRLAYGGKGSDAHKAGVVGARLATHKVRRPQSQHLIKLMSMVSVVIAGLVVRYSLTALEIFWHLRNSGCLAVECHRPVISAIDIVLGASKIRYWHL